MADCELSDYQSSAARSTKPVKCPDMLFTICTATFNRAHTLQRVFDSLSAQTLDDFEWIIIDDGSTDETKFHVSKWQETAPFEIRYHYQPNKGKHIAINKGVDLAQGEFLLSLTPMMHF